MLIPTFLFIMYIFLIVLTGWTHLGKQYPVTKFGLFMQLLIWVGIYMAGYVAPPMDTWFDGKSKISPATTEIIDAKIHTDK